MSQSEIQFGINLQAVSSWQDFQQLVLRPDELGYGVFAAPRPPRPASVLRRPEQRSRDHGSWIALSCS